MSQHDRGSGEGFGPSPRNLDELIDRLGEGYVQARRKILEAAEVLADTHRMLGRWSSLDGEADELSGASFRSPRQGLEAAKRSSRSRGAAGLDEVFFPQVKIYCLGRFRAFRGDEPIHARRRSKGDGVLKLLLVHFGASLPKEALIEALWQDSDVALAEASLRVAVHSIRKRLSGADPRPGQPEYILFRSGSYSINAAAPLWADFKEFEDSWGRGCALEKQGRESEAIAEYERAQGLYQGDFLEEDVYEDWSILKRETLRDAYLNSLGKTAEFHLRTGNHMACIESSRRILAQDPCREDAYRFLMRCHNDMGNRSHALRWYRLCAEALHRELGCPVSPETEELYNSLGRGTGPRPLT